jgi:hypothetical protein
MKEIDISEETIERAKLMAADLGKLNKANCYNIKIGELRHKNGHNALTRPRNIRLPGREPTNVPNR